MWELTNETGKKVLVSDELYEQKKKVGLKPGTKARHIEEPDTRKPYERRQQEYGEKARYFPYSTEMYDKYGGVQGLNDFGLRTIAAAKDVFSLPARGLVGGLNQMITGENTTGKTSEEWGADGGVLGTTASIATDPMTLPTAVPVGKVFGAGKAVGSRLNAVPGVKNLFEAGTAPVSKGSKLAEAGRFGAATGAGAVYGLADNAIKQEGYGTTPGIAAGVGALTAIAPYVGVRTLEFLRNRIKGIDRMTWEELKALVNRALRGPNAADLDDMAIMRQISQNPELVDEIARNANKPYFNAAQNEANASTANILNNTPTPPMGRQEEIKYKEFVGPKNMRKVPTTKENELIEQAKGIEAELKNKKKEERTLKNIKNQIEAEQGNRRIFSPDGENMLPTAKENKLIEQAKEIESNLKLRDEEGVSPEKALKNIKNRIEAESRNRRFSWSEGEDMFRDMKDGPSVISDSRSKKFIDNVADAFDDANNKMVANWNFISDRIEQSPGWQGMRQNSRGQYYAVNPERIGKIALDEIHNFQNKVLGRARNKSRGMDEADPIVTNEDVANLLNKLSQYNLFEHMDAVLKACTWLDEGTKRKLAENAMRNKVFGNAKLAMDKPVNRNYEKVESVSKEVKNGLNRVPGVKVLIPDSKEVKGIPIDFSKRYSAAVDGTFFRRLMDQTDDRLKRPFIFTPAGINVVSGKEEK